MTVAASSHQTKAQGGRFSVTGPGTPPANTQNINASEATGSTFTASVAGTTPLVVSPSFNITTTTGMDGCTAYPANTFQNAIALISRGTCTFGVKVAAAIAAGAVAVLISDNRAEDTFGATLGMTVARPVFAISQASGMALQSFVSAHTGTTMQLPYHYQRDLTLPDQLARFSLLGPGEVNVIKPEVQAPGVSILAAVARSGTNANTVDFLDGTSMATPHTAGAIALVRAAHPTWSPMEVKSALVMTSKDAGLTKADAVTASDPFDRGAGRIQVDQAIKTALIMNETNFSAYKFGADMATLNMPSMQTNNCITPVTPPTPAVTSNKNCSFTRIFRNVTNTGTPTLWAATLSGVSGTITPSNFVSYPDTNQSLNIQIDATAYGADGTYHFGKLTLISTNHPEYPPLHLPIAVAIQQPTIFTQRYMQIDIPAGTTTATGHLNITNSGGPNLTISNTNLVDTGTTTHTYLVANQPVPHVNNGTASSFLTDAMSGIYAADDFYVAGDPSIAKGTVALSKIDVTGFMTATHTLASLAGHQVHFEIYADNGTGSPNGAPEAINNPADPTGDLLNPGDPGNELPVWSFVGTIGGMMGTTTVPQSPGLTITSASGTDRIVLDLTHPMYTGDQPFLFTGKYWLLVYPETVYGTAAAPVDKLWAWAQSSVSTGTSPWTQFAPAAGADPLAWTSLSDNAAMRLEQKVQCGASWMTATIPSLTLPGKIGSNVLGITVNNSLTAFDHAVGYLCLQTNDPTSPVAVVRVDVYQH